MYQIMDDVNTEAEIDISLVFAWCAAWRRQPGYLEFHGHDVVIESPYFTTEYL